MRPLRISMEGFTCFREKQVIDFTAFDLFAISGPTGAGKTSMLDGMLFALYGRVPRVERYAELISLGCDRMTVCLDFRVGGRDYRITRNGRRKVAAEAQLAELENGTERPLAGGVREVNDRVVRLLGLTFEAFTQSVVLPQGEFMKFLKSPPAKRREILRDLLRLHIYERMREQSAARQKELAAEVANLEGLLRDEYADATQETVDKLQEEKVAVGEGMLVTAGRLKDRDTEVQELRERHRLTKDLEKRLARSRQLAVEEPQVLTQETRLNAARRVAPVLNLLQAAAEAEQSLQDAKRQQAQAAEELRRARAAHEGASLRLEKAERDAAEIPRLNERIRKLDEVKGQLKARGQAEARLEKLRGQQAELKAKWADARDAAKEAQARVKSREKDAARATAELEAVGYDAAHDERLADARALAAPLAQQREQAEELRQEAARAEAKAEELAAAVERARAALDTARERLKKAEQKVSELEQAAKEAHLRHAAALLRRELSAGEPCPVCDQPVVRRPKAAVAHADALGEADEQLARAKADLEQTRKAAEEKQSKADTSQELLADARDEAAKDRKKAGDAAKQVEKAERKLEALAGELLEGVKGALEVRVLAAADAVREKKKQWEQASRERDKADKALEKARGETKAAAERAQGLEERLAQQAEAIQTAEAEIRQSDAEIAKVTRHPEPLVEREQLAQRIEELEEARKEAQREERDAKSAESEAEAQARAADRQVGQAEKQADRAVQRARAAVKDAGFADEQEAKAFALSAEAMEKLEAEVTAWRSEKNALAQRLNELQAALAGREVDDRMLEAAEKELADLRKDHSDMRVKHAKLEEQLTQLRKKVKNARELRKKLDERTGELNTYRELAEELKSDRFQAFILRETIQELVAGASERLWALSNRYKLEFRDEAFHVLDYDNARERRSTDTLSGGETFLASLSLALQLSEQVQRAAGSVVLDSLFIDEGFGTLDPETLNTVTEAIESLPAGGRMVGIITHIPELTARLPARLLVTKHSEGSRVQAELDT